MLSLVAWFAVFALAAEGAAPAPSSAASAGALTLLPPATVLTSPAARQTLVLERRSGDDFAGQVVEGVTYTSSDPSVAIVEQGQIIPQGNGTATLTATSPEGTATANVTVERFEEPMAWSFRQHVLPVLAKSGCNSGACHGAAAGKNGFRLSLRGFDPMTDWLTLTRQARARRVLPSDPGRSLLLLKPTGAVPHRGGVRFDVGSPDYQVLAEWIAQGAAAPSAGDPQLDRLELLPASALLAPGAKQALIVRAHYTDGRAEDVTRWVKFTSTDAAVCQVDDGGQVTVVGSGEAAVTAWFASRIVVASITAPQQIELPAEAFAGAARRNFIDELVLAKLERLRVPPSTSCDDATFLRRAYLDTIGRLPEPEEARAFLADASPDKRERVVDALLERPEFVDYWTYKWCDLLLVNSEKLPGPALWAYQRWIRDRVAANTPWDALARDLLTASGSTLENGAANFFVLHGDPQALAENTTQAFLGTSINCARCHNHPLEKWTNAQYYAMANLFARVRVKSGADGERIVYAATEGDLVHPLVGRPQPPQPLDGLVVPADSTRDRRAFLADWLTAPENPYFARAIANRVWANFLGVGLVEAVDDLRVSNPASNERLLSALADHLRQHNYDLKSLMRVILSSSTYQRSSQALPANSADERAYARFYPRRLMSETLLDAVSQATDVPTEFSGYPAGYRALQLPDAAVPSYFLKTFGRPDRVITCECERNAEPNMVQALHLANGDTVNQKLAAPHNRLARLLESGAADAAILEELYLAALTRYPTDAERSAFMAELASAPTGDAAARRQTWEDLFWSVLGSKEFLFND